MRRAENTNIPGSSYQKAQIEYELRHKHNMENAIRNQLQVIGKSGKKYYVKREIGRGSFGTVYLAEGEDSVNYALKFLSPVNEEVKIQFEAEAQSVSELEHLNIVKIFDYGEGGINSANGIFIISEYCPDGDYKTKITANKMADSAGIEAAILDIKQILEGLEILHTKIVHRDLKPANILVASKTLKIADFGLAKCIDEATRTLTFKGSGTPKYMAPEIWSYKHAKQSADLYSLGVIFFEILAGTAPFISNDIHELRNMHLTKPAPRVKTINPLVPDKIDGLIKKLLLKEPEKRYQSAKEVLEALDNAKTEPKPELTNILGKARKFHDDQEGKKNEHQLAEEKNQEDLSKNQYKETEVIDLVESVIDELNTHMQEVKITKQSGMSYTFDNRRLQIHFFAENELFRNPEIPGRMKTLTNNFVVHGGYIEIKENGEDRQGWNLYLTRKPDEMYGEWFIVETDVSPLTGKALPYPPTMATDAKLFADNLSCHMAHTMHVYNLKTKPIQRQDIIKIIEFFIP
jgi:serine/threonine protein kinase